MDSKIKLWEVYNRRRLIQTFSGHKQAVRDVSFNNEGTQFLSASYDRSALQSFRQLVWGYQSWQCSEFLALLPECALFASSLIPSLAQILKFFPMTKERHFLDAFSHVASL